MNIHPTAIIDKRANIDESTSIGPYTIIGGNVRIGKNNKIGPHVVIEGNTKIGDGNKIFQFASIGSEPQDLKYQGENTELIIGNENIIREYVTIQPGVGDGRKTLIGSKNLFMGSSHIAHDCVVGENCWFANSAAIAGHVRIGNSVIVGGLAGVHQFCNLGDYSFIGAGSMVSMDVAPYCMVQGDRASIVYINKVGLERAGFSDDKINRIISVFKQVFYSEGLMKDKIEGLLDKYKNNDEVVYMLEFIKNSPRGVTTVKRK